MGLIPSWMAKINALKKLHCRSSPEQSVNSHDSNSYRRNLFENFNLVQEQQNVCKNS